MFDQSITYDEIGNPLTYGDLSFTWEKGRRLSQITDGENTYSYTYNADGIRTSKTVNGVRIDYVLEGDRIVYQKHSTGEEIWYNYDASGKLLGFHRRTAEGLTGNYYYIRNGQGDILGFHNQSGRVVVRYTYDAWGKVISISGSMAGTLGKMNPFRYRGYYYDEETGLYYLNSRYYNPDWGRFVNGDEFIQTGQSMFDKNMFSYCMNNPVSKHDPTGNVALEAMAGGAIAGLGLAAKVVGAACIIGITLLLAKMASDAITAVRDIPKPKEKKKETKKVYFKAKSTHPGAEVYIDQPLSLDQAKFLLDMGVDIWATDADSAKKLCIATSNGYSGPTNDQNPKNAIHYHPISYAARAHVFFGEDPNLVFTRSFNW